MGFTFGAREPVAVLAPFVEQLWYAHGRIGYRRELMARTGSCVAVVVLGDPIVAMPLAGAARPCSWSSASREARTTARGQPAHRRDARGRRRHHARRRRAGGADRCARAVAVLEAGPGCEIAALAARPGVSHGHLDREFARHVGLTSRAHSRIVRLRRALADLDVFGDVAWSRVAADAGWSDQSHFSRDLERHTGVMPSAYLRSQRAESTAADAAPGFVPER